MKGLGFISPVSAFLAVLDDTVEATETLETWLATNPPLADVQRAVRKNNVTPGSLGSYAKRRSTSDRSKLWTTPYDVH